MIRMILLVAMVSCGHFGLAQVDTGYYNASWGHAKADDYKFYRIARPDDTTMPGHKLLRVVDYYKDGKIQMDGYVLAADTTVYMGLYRWYTKKGRLDALELFDVKNSLQYFPVATRYVEQAAPCNEDSISLFAKMQPDGHLYALGYFKGRGSSRKICVWKEYNVLNKKIVTHIETKEGQQHGMARTYFPTGEVMKERYYKFGKKTRYKKTYGKDGSLKKAKHLDDK